MGSLVLSKRPTVDLRGCTDTAAVCCEHSQLLVGCQRAAQTSLTAHLMLESFAVHVDTVCPLLHTATLAGRGLD